MISGRIALWSYGSIQRMYVGRLADICVYFCIKFKSFRAKWIEARSKNSEPDVCMTLQTLGIPNIPHTDRHETAAPFDNENGQMPVEKQPLEFHPGRDFDSHNCPLGVWKKYSGGNLTLNGDPRVGENWHLKTWKCQFPWGCPLPSSRVKPLIGV